MPPQEPNTPKPLDPSSLLLPKKESVSPDTASRVNAAALLAQEQQAELQKPEPSKPVAIVQPKAPESTVKPLETFRSDIERAVQGGASIVTIAAAEADRRAQGGRAPEAKAADPHLWRHIGYLAAGLVLLCAAGGVLLYLLSKTAPLPVAQTPQAPFISVDETKVISEPANPTRDQLMTDLTAAKQKVALSVGLVEWLYPAQQNASTSAQEGIPAAQFLQTLAPTIPGELLRTLEPTYLVGVHSYDQNQPFLLLTVDSYEVAYAAMLQWERTMESDLLPFFNRDLSPQLPSQQSPDLATTSQAFVPSNFVDQVVENRDTRVLFSDHGDLKLLWTMLGRNTILITTNKYTLREVISRMNQAPTIPATP